MLLTCPTCRSGLQVPDGTTAHVRCPTCKTVFSAADGLAPPAPPPPAVPRPAPPKPTLPRPAVPPQDDEDDRPRPKARPRPRDDEDDDDRPRKRPRRRDDGDREDKDDRRDGIEDVKPPKKKRRQYTDDRSKLTPEEKARRRAVFGRGVWGSRLIQISLLFYIPGVLLVPAQIIVSELTHGGGSVLLVLAGILGLVNWVLGAIGLGLCLAGPVSPGHWRFGIAAAVAIVFHALLMLALVAKTGAHADFRDLDQSTAQWGAVATQYDSLSFYLAYVVYPDDIPLKRADTILSFMTGVVEMTRLILILMTLACLAQACGDRQLSDKCTRMAGRVSIIPGILALGMLAYKVFVVETGAEHEQGIVIATLRYILRGINSVVGGILLFAYQTVTEVVDACEFPFQTEIDLGGGFEASPENYLGTDD